MRPTVQRFRHELRSALDLWVAEELIEPAHAERLRAYYAVDELGSQVHAQFDALLLLAAAVLIGMGLIDGFAASQAFGEPGMRLLVALAFMTLTNVGGFWLLNRPGRERVGEALLVLGTFGFAAASAVLAQRFQLASDGMPVWAGWAAGTVAMALATRLPSLGWLGAAALTGTLATGLDVVAPGVAWGFAGLAYLAYRTHAAPLLWVAAGAGLGALVLATGDGPLGYAAFFFGLAGGISAIACHRRLMPLQSLREALVQRRPDAFVLNTLGGLEKAEEAALGVMLFGMLMALIALADGTHGPAALPADAFAGVTLLAAFVAVVLAWVRALGEPAGRTWRLAMGLTAAIAALVITTDTPAGWSVIALHLPLAVFALALLREGLATWRPAFMGLGATTAVVQVAACFSLPDTGLAARGLGLAVAGALVGFYALRPTRSTEHRRGPVALPD